MKLETLLLQILRNQYYIMGGIVSQNGYDAEIRVEAAELIGAEAANTRLVIEKLEQVNKELESVVE